jgi:hypothetical protein
MGWQAPREITGALENVFRGTSAKGQKAMNETKAIRIASVKYAGDFKLRLRWVNRSVTLVDLSEPIHRLKGLQPLLDAEVFARAKKGEGGHSVAWPMDVDIGADRLWEMALEQTGHHDTVEFLRWRWRYGLSLTDAANALGLSRRQVAYYASSKHPVPRTVLLACKGWEAERKAA